MTLTGDKKMEVDGLASAVGIPREEVQNLLHQHLNVKKFPAWWVLRFLAVDLKQ